MICRKILILLFILLIITPRLFPQNDTNNLANIRNNAIKVFLDCGICDLNYLRENIQFVNYVSFEQEADVYILVTSQQTASRGNELSFFFIGQNRFKGINDTLKIITKLNETDDERRDKSTHIISVGLIRYVAKTDFLDYLKISLNLPQQNMQKIDDPWDSWFFRLSSNFYANGEKSFSSINTWSSFRINRITPNSKYEFNFTNNYNSSNYLINDSVSIKSSTNYNGFNNLIVKSLGEHWSIGGSVDIASSEYRNLKFSFTLKPSIEFNIYPFSEATRRQFRFLYGVGISQNYYNDTTIYMKTKEFLFLHSLNIAFEQIETWGSINLSARWRNYLKNFKFNNLNIYSQISFRLFKGLSFDLSGGVSLVHDQINLPKKGASYEEILTRQRQLESQYDYWLSGGLSFSFGSIYNNVVNPRFNL